MLPPLFKTVQNYFGPKGEARTHGPRAPLVPKAKLGYSDRLWSVFEFCTLSGEGIGYSDCLWSVFEFCTLSGGGIAFGLQNCAKLFWSHSPLFKTVQNYFGPTPPFKTVQNYFGPKGEARTHGPHALLVPRAKLGHTDCVHHRSKRRS